MNHPREQAEEVQGFISGGGRLKEVRLLIGDSAHRLCLKAGELDKPKRRKRRSRQTIRSDSPQPGNGVILKSPAPTRCSSMLIRFLFALIPLVCAAGAPTRMPRHYAYTGTDPALWTHWVLTSRDAATPGDFNVFPCGAPYCTVARVADAIRVWVLRKDRRGPDRQDAVGPSPGRIVGA